MVLDKGWLKKECTSEMNPENLDVLYRLEEIFPGQKTAHACPAGKPIRTAIMFTCRALLEEFGEFVTTRSTFAINHPSRARAILLGQYRGSSKIRGGFPTDLGFPKIPGSPKKYDATKKKEKLHGRPLPLTMINAPVPPNPEWIRVLHLRINKYSVPVIPSHGQYQDAYYAHWQETIFSLATQLTKLKELHLYIDVPYQEYNTIDLNQKWFALLGPFVNRPSIKECRVTLCTQWALPITSAFEEYLTRRIMGKDERYSFDAIVAARERYLRGEYCSEEMTAEKKSYQEEEWTELIRRNMPEEMRIAEEKTMEEAERLEAIAQVEAAKDKEAVEAVDAVAVAGALEGAKNGAQKPKSKRRKWPRKKQAKDQASPSQDDAQTAAPLVAAVKVTGVSTTDLTTTDATNHGANPAEVPIAGAANVGATIDATRACTAAETAIDMTRRPNGVKQRRRFPRQANAQVTPSSAVAMTSTPSDNNNAAPSTDAETAATALSNVSDAIALASHTKAQTTSNTPTDLKPRRPKRPPRCPRQGTLQTGGNAVMVASSPTSATTTNAANTTTDSIRRAELAKWLSEKPSGPSRYYGTRKPTLADIVPPAVRLTTW